MTSTPVLEVESLAVRYGRVTGVSDVSLTVHDGEAVALVGPNGAGKTTTMRGIAGFLPREGARVTGNIRFDGRSIRGSRPWDVARLGIRTIPAGTKVFSHLSVREHLRLAGPRGSRRGEDDDAIALFPALRARLDSSAASLSGGERQMLALALAMAANPRLLMVDELSQGLAPAAVSTIVNTLVDLNGAGLTLILIEQSLSVALDVADRYYALEAGRVTDEGRGGDYARAPSSGAAAPPASRQAAEDPVRTSGDPIIRAENVNVRFRGITALTDVSVDVYEGECVGLLGPNGAGKTTLLNTISRAITQESGEIYVGGESIAGRAAHDLPRMGVVRTFQSAELWQGMSVLDVVALGVHHLRLGRRAAEAKAREALEVVGLADVQRVRVGDLPYGYAKLTDLARALASNPTVLLLDEPASGLSQAERDDMVAVLTRVRREMHVTQVLIEHDMQLVQRCCSRIVVLSHGVVIAEGEPRQVLSDRRVAEELLGIVGTPMAVSGAERTPADVPLGG